MRTEGDPAYQAGSRRWTRPALLELILAVAPGCVLSSVYGFLSGAWPFGVVELVWSGVAVNRFRTEQA